MSCHVTQLLIRSCLNLLILTQLLLANTMDTCMLRRLEHDANTNCHPYLLSCLPTNRPKIIENRLMLCEKSMYQEFNGTRIGLEWAWSTIT